MNVTGTIYKINDTQVVSERFSKREFIIITDASTPYPNHIKLDVTQDKCALLDKYKVGQEVSVDFNLKGRLFNGMNREQCFINLNAWKISLVNESPMSQETTFTTGKDDGSDLPF
jgi:single-strand DNA-binding protein